MFPTKWPKINRYYTNEKDGQYYCHNLKKKILMYKQEKQITTRLNQLAGVTKPTNKNTFKTTKQ